MSLSHLSLLLVSCLRLASLDPSYRAIVYPLKPRFSKLTSLSAIAVIWVISLFISVPYIHVSVTTHEVYLNGESAELCVYRWPDGIVSKDQLEFL